MALPLLGSLLARYGLRKLGEKGAKELRAVASSRLKSGATEKEILKATKRARRKQVAGNVLGDSTGAYMAGDAVMSSFELDKFKRKKELRKYIKENRPKVWREFTRSSFDDIEEFLKFMKSKRKSYKVY